MLYEKVIEKRPSQSGLFYYEYDSKILKIQNLNQKDVLIYQKSRTYKKMT